MEKKRIKKGEEKEIKRKRRGRLTPFYTYMYIVYVQIEVFYRTHNLKHS